MIMFINSGGYKKRDWNLKCELSHGFNSILFLFKAPHGVGVYFDEIDVYAVKNISIAGFSIVMLNTATFDKFFHDNAWLIPPGYLVANIVPDGKLICFIDVWQQII